MSKWAYFLVARMKYALTLKCGPRFIQQIDMKSEIFRMWSLVCLLMSYDTVQSDWLLRVSSRNLLPLVDGGSIGTHLPGYTVSHSKKNLHKLPRYYVTEGVILYAAINKLNSEQLLHKRSLNTHIHLLNTLHESSSRSICCWSNCSLS
jgi:hypothetical protein